MTAARKKPTLSAAQILSALEDVDGDNETFQLVLSELERVVSEVFTSPCFVLGVLIKLIDK